MRKRFEMSREQVERPIGFDPGKDDGEKSR